MYKITSSKANEFINHKEIVDSLIYADTQKNKQIPRKKLTQKELVEEVIALQNMGHKRLAIEAGEDPRHNSIDYILECIKKFIL